MLQVYICNVSDILEICFKRFHTDVAKVDRDVAYVAIVIQVCCKHLSPMFHLFFQMYVASMFISMLQVFYLDVAYVCNGF
jgi:hypothetical protein